MELIVRDLATASPTTETTTLDDIPQRSIIESDKDALAIVNITDRTKTEGLPYDMAEEKFFEDGNNEYYFSGIYSHYVIVHYGDGSQEDIVAALNTGKANISDLDKFGVSYIVKPLELESAELPDNPINRESGGAAYTIRYAKERGLEIVTLSKIKNTSHRETHFQ